MNEKFNLMSAIGILRLLMRHPGITIQGLTILTHAEQYLQGSNSQAKRSNL